MPDPKHKTKKAFVIKDFKDAGTETSFTAKSVPDIEEGAFANYEAAGLVRLATAEEVKAANGPADDGKAKAAA